MKKNPQHMVDICENLLKEAHIEEAIRIGDCLALLIDYFHSRGDMKRAYEYIEEMRLRHILLHPYIDAEVLAEIHQTLGKPIPGNEEEEEDNVGGADEDEAEEDINEVDDEVLNIF